MSEDVKQPEDRFPEYRGLSIAEAAAALRGVQTTLEENRKTGAELQARVDCLRDLVLPAALDAAGLKTATVPNVGRVQLTSDLYARINAADRAAAYTWLRENGYDALITETVNAQTLKGWAKEQIRNGNPVPESIILTPFTRATLTKE